VAISKQRHSLFHKQTNLLKTLSTCIPNK